MCSIGAIMLYPDYDSRKLRSLILNLLSEMIARGTDASGIAVVYNDGKIWLRKAPIEGTVFARIIEKISGWEEDARVVLLHTRAATQGSPYNNENNHPLWKIYGDVMYILVHNGHVHSKSVSAEREVDSDAIITAIREECKEKGLDTKCVKAALEKLSGSMAIAVTDTKTKTLVLYRNTNPTACAIVPEIGLVCASTETILINAVKASGLDYKRIGYTKPYTIFHIPSAKAAESHDSLFSSEYHNGKYYYYKYNGKNKAVTVDVDDYYW